MTEICVKINASLEETKRMAIEKGFEFIESYNNHDTYFSTIDKENLKKVTYKNLLDNSIIVRHITGENCDVRNLVYKKKTLDEKGNVIEEVKTKVKVDDVEKVKNIFKNIDLSCWCDFVNENNEYRKGEIILNIQHVKELGTFIEIEEYPSIANKTDKEKFDILVNIINSFGFSTGKDYSCKKPYMFLNLK